MGAKAYTKEFKLGAVRLVVEEKKSLCSVAKNLGLSSATMHKWVRHYKKSGQDAFPGKGFLVPTDERIRELEKKLRRAEMERDLLKKTIVFFAEQDRINSKQ